MLALLAALAAQPVAVVPKPAPPATIVAQAWPVSGGSVILKDFGFRSG